MFNIANTIPNMLYILLAGGVFNAVLVPQLVRACAETATAGAAYTNQIVTLAALFLAAVTVSWSSLAPLLMRLLLDPVYLHPTSSRAAASIIALARYCLPQVFFYGMFVLLGQVLNARGSFGPMMWAPIANNVIAIGVLGVYLPFAAGPAPSGLPRCARASRPQLEAGALLGIGSTFGHRRAAAGAAALPAPGGLHLLALASTSAARAWATWPGWVSGRCSSWWSTRSPTRSWSGSPPRHRQAPAAPARRLRRTGYTVYSNSFLLVMVPHAVITVSLATAVLPRLSAYAAEGSCPRWARAVSPRCAPATR